MVSGRSLVEDAVSGAKIAVVPCHPALAVVGLPLPVGRGPYRAASLFSFGICSIVYSVSDSVVTVRH